MSSLLWQMYHSPPTLTIGFERLRKLATDRVSLLRKAEELCDGVRNE